MRGSASKPTIRPIWTRLFEKLQGARRGRSSSRKATSRRTGAPPTDSAGRLLRTTNYDTEVAGRRWIAVERPEMDCAIVLDDGGAMTVAPFRR